MSGEDQAIRLPKDLYVAGREVYIKAVGNAIVLIPFENSWATLSESLSLFTDDFMATRDQPEVQQRERPFAP